MDFITNDEYGIPNKEIYSALARSLKKGPLGSRRIKRDAARYCTELKLVSDELTNLEFLSFFPNLEELYLTSPKLSNIQGLRHVSKLDWLDIKDHNVTDLSPLAHCRKLTAVQMKRKSGQNTGSPMGLPDLSLLSELTILALEGLNIVELSWITGIEKLEAVDLAHNPITDFSPLLQMPNLNELDLDSEQMQYTDERYKHLFIEVIGDRVDVVRATSPLDEY